ncbi:hypothetical protein [Haloarcula amylovorans]|uniref:hypothetical protein n=1 Tax=Haloarcula amylovorans TaxID=2562280 RepID=UPI001075FA45|nr:hypothetical protein [Halomicroarcula amylolytica]
MSCTVEARARVRRAARAIRDCAPTVAVDVLEPSDSSHDCWTLEVALRDRDGIPPAVTREIAIAGLTLRPVPSQPGYQPVVATV